MKAIIPVAGLGSRLRPHTYTLPKVLLNVAGKPILGHILDELVKQSVRDCVIITGYMGNLVEEYVSTHFDLNVEFIEQKELNGLGHAIWLARESFPVDEPVFLILGDTIFDVDLAAAFLSPYSSLGVKKVDDPRRFGVVEKDSSNFIAKLVEKPEVPISNLALVGLYNIKQPALLREALEYIIGNNIRTRNEYQLTDALQYMIEHGEKFTTFNVEGWYDCGKPETLLETNRFLLEKKSTIRSFPDSIIIPPVYIAPNAVIQSSVVGPYVTIAENGSIQHSIVRNTIISDGASVSHSMLDSSILGNNARINGQYRRVNVGDSSEVDFSYS
jgi:glucose-1-phosphate thymidylyltransferase